MLYLLDLFGVAVIAVSGALRAGRKGMDLLGVFVIAVATAIGAARSGTSSSTARCSGSRTPPTSWSSSPPRRPSCSTPALFAPRRTRSSSPTPSDWRSSPPSGPGVADLSGAPPLIVVVMGALTGAACGILRDVLCAEVPLILRRDVYATASLAGGALFVLLSGLGVDDAVAVTASVATVFALRLAAIRWRLNTPAIAIKDDENRGW